LISRHIVKKQAATAIAVLLVGSDAQFAIGQPPSAPNEQQLPEVKVQATQSPFQHRPQARPDES
jgi:hypothetical protein